MYALASLPEPIAHYSPLLSPHFLNVYPMCQCALQIKLMRTKIQLRLRHRWLFVRTWDRWYLTTLPMCRRSSAAPLGRIDYNVGILSPSPSYERLAMASQPCLLTPAQAALAHALGTVQGRAHALPS